MHQGPAQAHDMHLIETPVERLTAHGADNRV